MADTNTKPEKITVDMGGGRTQEFGKKQKLVKTSTIGDNGAISLVLDFVNGQSRTIDLAPNDPLYARFAAHGAEQKFGDAIAGETDIDDAVLAVDDVIARVANGEWTAQRQAGAMSGTSVLIRALIEASGKSVDEVKAFLANKSQAEKLALRRSDKLRPIVERLESEKAAKSAPSVDTNALLGELGLSGSGTAAKKKVAEPA